MHAWRSGSTSRSFSNTVRKIAIDRSSRLADNETRGYNKDIHNTNDIIMIFMNGPCARVCVVVCGCVLVCGCVGVCVLVTLPHV